MKRAVYTTEASGHLKLLLSTMKLTQRSIRLHIAQLNHQIFMIFRHNVLINERYSYKIVSYLFFFSFCFIFGYLDRREYFVC